MVPPSLKLPGNRAILWIGGAAVELGPAQQTVGARVEPLELSLGIAFVAGRDLETAQRGLRLQRPRPAAAQVQR